MNKQIWMHKLPLDLIRNETNMVKALELNETQQYHYVTCYYYTIMSFFFQAIQLQRYFYHHSNGISSDMLALVALETVPEIHFLQTDKSLEEGYTLNHGFLSPPIVHRPSTGHFDVIQCNLYLSRKGCNLNFVMVKFIPIIFFLFIQNGPTY